MTNYVLDSFALIAWLRLEPGVLHVRKLVADTVNRHWMSVINLGEVYYKVSRVEGPDDAEKALVWASKLPVTFSDVDRDMVIDAARIKATYPISYADSFAAALAREHGARVITGDPEFITLEQAGVVEIEWLPQRSRR